jgi:asparaginyl-tRNA synthetase
MFLFLIKYHLSFNYFIMTEFKFKRSHTLVKDLYENPESIIGSIHRIKGYIRFLRSQGSDTFIRVYDGSCGKCSDTFQLIVNEKSDVVQSLTVGDCISAIGEIVKSPAKEQPIEMIVSNIAIIGKVNDPQTYFPASKRTPLETMRQKEHLHLRVKFQIPQAIFRIRSRLSQAYHEFMKQMDLYHLDPNTITLSDCEGAGEVFTITSLMKDGSLSKIPTKEITKIVTNDDGSTKEIKEKSDEIDFSKDFFLNQAYMTVSSQLGLESLCAGIGGVYTSNPSFRAEPSETSRHVCSFTHHEWEIAHIDLNQLMDFSEDLVKYSIKCVIADCQTDIKILEQMKIAPGLNDKLQKLIECDFSRVSYDSAIEIIEKDRKEIQKKFKKEHFPIPKWGDDLGSYCERYLADDVFKKPVFVHTYPLKLKSFYMKQKEPYIYTYPTGDTEERETVESCDLLVPGLGELIGSSIRENSYEKLLGLMQSRNMDIAKYEWYLDLRKNASTPTGGAGLGFDRLVMVCTSTDGGNIRDVIPFPVAYKSCLI